MELYRYDDSDITDGFELRKFEVIKQTPKGFWILEKWEYSFQIDLEDEGKKRWVSATGRKRFAYPTKKEALEHYQFRKRSQIRHLERTLHFAKTALRKANQKSDIEVRPYSDTQERLELGKWTGAPWNRFGDFLSEDDMNL